MNKTRHNQPGHQCRECTRQWKARVRRAHDYLTSLGDPAMYPDQKAITAALDRAFARTMWDPLHREPGHYCEVCSTGPIPDGPYVSYRRQAAALSHLLRGGDPATFEDPEAIAVVLPVYERYTSAPDQTNEEGQ